MNNCLEKLQTAKEKGSPVVVKAFHMQSRVLQKVSSITPEEVTGEGTKGEVIAIPLNIIRDVQLKNF